MTDGQRTSWTASRTLWTRLEPRTRDTQLDEVLRAEVHDPAWLLCRQWQVGEFQGEDAGSPVDAELAWERDEMSRFRVGSTPGMDSGPPKTDDAALESDAERTETPDYRGEREALAAIGQALANHRSEQQRGSGDPQPPISTFDDYLGPEQGQLPAVRRRELRYLDDPVLSHPRRGSDVSFFDRATVYLSNQPDAEVTAGGVGIGDLVDAMEAYVQDGDDRTTAVDAFRRLVRTGTAATTAHLRTVVGYAEDAARAAASTSGSGTDGGGNGDGTGEPTDPAPPRDYDGEPLEVLVERESVTTPADDGPSATLRAEAGQQFLRCLADAGYTDDGTPFAAADFAVDDGGDSGRFVLSPPDEPVDSDSRRFASVTAGRALDGRSIYRALVDAVAGIEAGDPTWPGDAADLPVPQGASVTAAYRDAAERYVSWYADLYDEPADADRDAWNADRLEYEFQVATGPADGETVFSSAEYAGGRLDWYSFTHTPDATLDPPDDETLTSTGTERLVPTPVRYPGMPLSRWWEFEDAAVNLDDVPAGPEELSKLLLLDFSLVHSNDWYTVPMETPVGSLTRLTDVTVTDTFGETTTLDAVDDDDWNTFQYHGLDATSDGEPGLLVPPTLGAVAETDPVERVFLERDETANVAFAVEERIESHRGDPLPREEFREPTLEIERFHAGPGVDLEDERVVLHNPGDAPLALDGWELAATVGTGATATTTTLFDFGSDAAGTVEVPPGETITVYSGARPPGAADDDALYAGETGTVWGTDQGEVTVLRPESEVADVPQSDRRAARFVTKELVSTPAPSVPDYRLATSVPDHWYPLKPVRPRSGAAADPSDADTYRLALALLLDADSMDDPLSRIPAPDGRILDTDEPIRLYEEEVPRDGREIERTYQFARWTDGSTYLWSGRHVSTGRGAAKSRLRYDVLSEAETE